MDNNYMTDPMGYPMDNALEYADRIGKMYPDSYRRIYPHVQETLGLVGDEYISELTGADMDRMVDDTMVRGNLMADPPRGHTPDTARDMARALLVRDLYDRHRRRGFFPGFPFPFLIIPFGGRGRERDRDYDRDYNRDQFRRY